MQSVPPRRGPETVLDGTKTDLLVCSFAKCKSTTSPDHPPAFMVRVEVDAAGNVISDVDDIETRYFDCSYCGSEATTKTTEVA